MLRCNNHACLGWQGASGFNPLALHHLKARHAPMTSVSGHSAAHLRRHHRARSARLPNQLCDAEARGPAAALGARFFLRLVLLTREAQAIREDLRIGVELHQAAGATSEFTITSGLPRSGTALCTAMNDWNGGENGRSLTT